MRAKIVFYFIRLFGRLPMPVLQRLGGGLGWLFYLFPNRERCNARITIDICFPEWDEKQKRALLKQSLIEGGKTLFEMPLFWVRQPEEWLDYIEIGEGYEVLQAALAEDRGLIIAGPHMGNWELTVQYMATLTNMTAIYRPPKMPELAELAREGRSRTGANMVPATPKGVKELLKALKSGGALGILCDQQPKAAGEQGAVFAPFFGRPALSMVLINRMARKTNAKVIFSYTERLSKPGHFKVHWREGSKQLLDADPVVAATAMNEILETCIRDCPEQYIWSYKRFHIQPEGMPSPYRKYNTG